MDQVSDVLLEFEEACVSKNHVLTEVPKDIRHQMADFSQDMAEFISSKADKEAIEKVIRGSRDDVTYTDEEIESRRVNLLFAWMSKVGHKLNEANSKPGVIRREAREKSLKKMSDAVDMAMSKHDQVLITGHSRLDRLQLPTCIACDRPLAAKKRYRDMPQGAAVAGTVPGGAAVGVDGGLGKHSLRMKSMVVSKGKEANSETK